MLESQSHRLAEVGKHFSLTWSFSSKGKSFVPHLPSSFVGTLCLKASLNNKVQGKKGTDYFGLFCVFCHQEPCLIQQQAHSSLCLPLVVNVPVEALLVALHIPQQLPGGIDWRKVTVSKVKLYLIWTDMYIFMLYMRFVYCLICYGLYSIKTKLLFLESQICFWGYLFSVFAVLPLIVPTKSILAIYR